METCDVLVVGAGPAGSTCARELTNAGHNVLLLDKQVFPRHKPCAGWITPQVFETLRIDPDEYRQDRVLQEINNFRTGLIHGRDYVISYGKTVSYGILRYEFDNYLLQRTGARHILGESLSMLERQGSGWMANGHIRAAMVVGAGGHFCPVARILGARIDREDAVVAQVAERIMSNEEERVCRIPADTPELHFSRDMKGYGWVFRKGSYLNIGLGRMDRKALPAHVREFRRFLEERKSIPKGMSATFDGHAYLLYDRRGRTRVDDGVILIGDAAGLSFPQSGEGIMPAVESARMAAEVILTASGDYTRRNLEPYEELLKTAFSHGGENTYSFLPASIRRFLGARLLSSSWFAREVVLDRWFLHHQ